MIYIPQEKEKMEILLAAFHSYIDQQEDYDVIYSEKAGYLRVLIGKSCDPMYFPITGFADMMRMFTDDFLQEADYHCKCNTLKTIK